MKKQIILLTLLLVFSFAKAQTILVNGNVVSVNQDVTFPFWLDSSATIESGSHVLSISALEFNIVPTTNGNSLVFSQTKTITSQQTVPNGKTWKLEGVLLDSTATTTTTGGGNASANGVGEKPVALSAQSATTMNLGAAMLYCDSLTEGGYDHWVVPTIEEIMYVAGGGGLVAGTRTSDGLWTSTPQNANDATGGAFSSPSIWKAYNYYGVELSDGGLSYGGNTGTRKVRCIRHETITTGSSVNSGNSGSLPTAISSYSTFSATYQQVALCIKRCDTLSENGYTDWYMPSLDELIKLGLDFDNGNIDWVGTRSKSTVSGSYLAIKFSTGETEYWSNTVPCKCRCIR